MKTKVAIALAACLGISRLSAQEAKSPDTNQPAPLSQEQHDKLAIEKVARTRWQIQTNCVHPEFRSITGNTKKTAVLRFKDKDYLEKL